MRGECASPSNPRNAFSSMPCILRTQKQGDKGRWKGMPVPSTGNTSHRPRSSLQYLLAPSNLHRAQQYSSNPTPRYIVISPLRKSVSSTARHCSSLRQKFVVAVCCNSRENERRRSHPKFVLGETTAFVGFLAAARRQHTDSSSSSKTVVLILRVPGSAAGSEWPVRIRASEDN